MNKGRRSIRRCKGGNKRGQEEGKTEERGRGSTSGGERRRDSRNKS